MFNISGFIENKINTILNLSISQSLKLVMPSNLTDTQFQDIINIILSTPKISQKIARFQSVILQQVQVGGVMAVNAVIGLIPVPIIPGIIRTTNNAIFQIMKTLDRINELNDIKNDTIQTFTSNQQLIQVLTASGIDAAQIQSKLENLDFKEIIPLVEENVKSTISNFTDPIKDNISTIIDFPENAVDTIGNVAEGVTGALSSGINDATNTISSVSETTNKAKETLAALRNQPAQPAQPAQLAQPTQPAQLAQLAQRSQLGGTKKRKQKTKNKTHKN